MLKLIKRSGAEAEFDKAKIERAIEKANESVETSARISEADIKRIAAEVTAVCEKAIRSYNVEEIQDMVEVKLMELGAYKLARKYITYRYTRELVRK